MPAGCARRPGQPRLARCAGRRRASPPSSGSDAVDPPGVPPAARISSPTTTATYGRRSAARTSSRVSDRPPERDCPTREATRTGLPRSPYSSLSTTAWSRARTGSASMATSSADATPESTTTSPGVGRQHESGEQRVGDDAADDELDVEQSVAQHGHGHGGRQQRDREEDEQWRAGDQRPRRHGHDDHGNREDQPEQLPTHDLGSPAIAVRQAGQAHQDRQCPAHLAQRQSQPKSS